MGFDITFYIYTSMSQVQTFPFSNLVSPVDYKPTRLKSTGTSSNISGTSSIPETNAKTKVFNGALYQETLETPKNPYFGPNILVGLPITSSAAILGQRVDLDVLISGYPINEFTFTWYRNGSVFTGDSYRSISNNPSGSVLTINAISSSDSGDTYTLRISNPYNDPTPEVGSYVETSTYVYFNSNLYHPDVLFTVVGAIQ